jgi:uncharacterized protein (DUF488 family)
MSSFDLFSIGHSNIPADRFLVLLRTAGVTVVADVRSIPASRHFPWFSKKNLVANLELAGTNYLPMGEALGGRPRDSRLYRDGVADYEAMAADPQYQAGIQRLIEAAAHATVCIMCAEREPLDCHRCLLVARSLAERGLKVGHILHDGTIEPHAATEQRLLKLEQPEQDCDLFASGQHERLAAAYRRRAHAAAFRRKPPATRMMMEPR